MLPYFHWRIIESGLKFLTLSHWKNNAAKTNDNTMLDEIRIGG